MNRSLQDHFAPKIHQNWLGVTQNGGGGGEVTSQTHNKGQVTSYQSCEIIIQAL